MNTSMHGRRIVTIGIPGPNGELQHFTGDFELSATHHGDHDQFWVVVRDKGAEVARYNARHIGHIVWGGAKPQSPLTIHRTPQVGDRVALKEDPEHTGVIESLPAEPGGSLCVEWDSEYGDKLTTISHEDLVFLEPRS